MCHLKKLFAIGFIILSIVFLTSCGGDKGVDTSDLKVYEGGEFNISIDPTWKIISSSEFYSEVPKETVVAFTTPEAYDGFFINVNVIRENLQQEVSSIDYGRANMNLSAQTLTDYTKIQEVKVDIGGKEALLHIFEARLNPSEKMIKFVQLYTTRENYGYIIAGGMLPDTPQEIRDLVGSTVTSFRFKL